MGIIVDESEFLEITGIVGRFEISGYAKRRL